ncbi:GMP reductase [Reinekea blandensis]|uniref:GMP reductase n=1 Tax=Reinekea blandensis MED297 TaxID=314283 RepID=A4BAK9_9GAMM|nr:GMP reductase [Reinekea blandensis]EAR10965.1 guanosine 5'-monophosphate oxidoreductase [Reinekea sp. MED297] [Reinekea blandensis MED297]
MHVETDIKLGFKNVMIRPKRSTLKSRSQVSLERTYTFRNSQRTWTGVPIIAANMDTVGTFEAATVMAEHKMLTAIHKHYSVDEWQAFLSTSDSSVLPYIMVSTGTSDADYDKLKAITALNDGLEFVCIDVANGYSEHFVEFVRRVRREFPSLTIMAGNVVTGEMTEELLLSGADIVKVGIGPGSVCTTRVKTGVGYPQVSATIECADAAHGLNGHVVSDGGCTCPGDVSKAFGAGADFVMLGGMLAGHDESGGELVEDDGKQYRLFYGMSSDTAMNKYHGGVANYRASEGKTVRVPYRGPLVATLADIQGGVRSTCTYVGAAALKELSKRTTFIRVEEQENQVFGR